LVLALALGAVSGSEATSLPAGFSQDVVTAGLNAPTAFAFFPDGRIAIAEKSGTVRLVKNGVLLPTPLISIGDRVNDYWDRGLIGIAVDPSFASNPHVYLLYTYENDPLDYEGPKTARLTRVTVVGDTASPASEVVILGTVVGRSCNDFSVGTDCLPSDSPSHSVGTVKVTADGTIYLTVGDGAGFNTVDPDAFRSQSLDSLSGKLLRVTRTGEGLPGNPYWTGDGRDNRSKIWAYGLRNAFRFNLRPGTLMPYLGDVGWERREKISAAGAGRNLGWPCYEGSEQQAGYAAYPVCQALYAVGAGTGSPPPPPPSGEMPLGDLAQATLVRVPVPSGSGGPPSVAHDGDAPPVGSADSSRQYDSYDGTRAATEDWIGFEFGTSQTFTRVVFQEGMNFSDGGWFATLTVEVRQNGQWVGVTNLAVTPAYPGGNGVSYETFTLTFDPIDGDAIRLHGVPGGSAKFISVGEVEVFGLADEGEPPATAATFPLYEYMRIGEGGAVVGGTFYTGTVYPVQYQGVYFFGDFAQNWLRTLRVDDADALVPEGVADFAEDADGPVDMEMGPDGLLYYLAITANELRRIRYTAGNTPPQAVASATPTSGLAPLSVRFSSAGSSDPNDDALAFEWDFGDGSPPGSGPDPEHTYANDGTYVATVTARDTAGASASDTVIVTVGNLPPIAVIDTPLAAFGYKVGDSVAYSGSATSPSQDPIPGATLTWQVILHHCPGGACHAHSFTSSSGLTGSFTVPDHGDASHFEIILTATDGGGLSHAVSRTIQPQTVQLTLATSLPGVQVVYDGLQGAAPLVRTTIVGSQHVINAPSPQGGSTFVSWSDGGAQQHTVTVGASNMTRTATFASNLPPVATINTPTAVTTFKVGDVVAYSGAATSAPQDAIPGATLTWAIVRHECPGGVCQTFTHATGSGATGSFTVGDHGDQVQFEIRLTALDNGGLSHTVTRTIQPQTVQLTLATNPAGLQVAYNGTTGTAPLVRTVIVNSVRTINAPSPQGGNTFVSWSDGGAQQHTVTVGATNVTHTASYSTAAGCPVGQYRAEYFNNVTLSGTPLLTRCETAVNYNWGSGGPGNGISNNNFSARWTGRLNFAAGATTFTTVSDDGVRLWVDNVLVINRWTDHGPTTDMAVRSLTAGEHEVRLEYYERGGGAVIQLTQSTQTGTCPTGQFFAEYFSNVSLSGTPLFTRCETTVNYSWGSGGPGNGIPNDNFSVRWSGRFTFPAGNRTFRTVSDDGVRLWVDNVLRINRWTDHASTTDTASVSLTAGDHDVRVEYYERGGGAVIQVSW
jgi:glucose/arabinose dehydrogenase/PKD repeat protein